MTETRTGPDAGALLLNEFLPYRLSIASELTSRLFSRAYEARFGIGIPEWRVMAVLGESAPMGTQDVIARTGMDRVRVSRAVIRLADKGLVERRADARDQRVRSLRLSRRGRQTYAEVVPLARALQASLVEALTAQEAAELDRLLQRVQGAAAAALSSL